MSSDRRDGPSQGFGRLGIIACLVGAAVHLIATRLVWGQIPLQTDTGIWAYFAARLLDGARLYGDLWESKPPGIFWTFAVVQRVFGVGGDRALLWLDAVVTVAVCGVTYATARCVASRGAATLAVSLLSVVMCHRILADWGNNLEKFVAFFEMAALWMIFRWASGRADDSGVASSQITRTPIHGLPTQAEESRPTRWLLIGLCNGLAATYKQTGILLLLILLVGIILRWRAIHAPRPGRAMMLLLAGAAIPWCIVLVTLLRDQSLSDFWRQVVVHDLQRATSAEHDRSQLLNAEHWAGVWRHLLMAGVLFFPAVVGACSSLAVRRRSGGVARAPQHARPGAAPEVSLITVYAVLATLVFVLAPFGYGHYLLQAAPPAAILVARAFDFAWPSAGQIGSARRVSSLPAVILILAILIGAWQLGEHLRFTLDSRCPPRRAYEMMRVRTQRLVTVVEESSSPGQSVLLWPASHAISYYAGRRTPLEMCQAIDIFNGRVRMLDPPLEEVIRRIEATPPERIIDWSPVDTEPEDPNDPTSPPVLVVPVGGFSLAEEPNPEHAHLEGRLLAPLKTWLRHNYGGQVRYRDLCTVYTPGLPWNDWQAYFQQEREPGVGEGR